IAGDLVYADRLPCLEHGACNSERGRKAQQDKRICDAWVFFGDVGEKQFLALRVEQQDRDALGIERLATLLCVERNELVELEARGERTPEVVEYSLPAVLHDTLSVDDVATPFQRGNRPRQVPGFDR